MTTLIYRGVQHTDIANQAASTARRCAAPLRYRGVSHAGPARRYAPTRSAVALLYRGVSHGKAFEAAPGAAETAGAPA